MRRAAAAASSAHDQETGGVLLGFRADDDIYVTDIAVVRAATATRTRYVSNETDRNAAIEAYQQAAPPEVNVGYVGTWHSHPGSSRASPRDRRTLRTEAADAPDLVGMIVLYRTSAGWQPDGYIGHHERALEHRRHRQILRRDPWVTPVDVTVVP